MKRQRYNRTYHLIVVLVLALLGNLTVKAQAGSYLEGFDTAEGNEDNLRTLPSGWTVIGNKSNFSLGNRYYKTSRPSLVYSGGGNTGDYVVTPAVSGTVGLWYYGTYKRGGSTLQVFECTEEGGTLVVGSEVASASPVYETWKQLSFYVGTAKRLAILMSRTAIDDFSATNDGTGDDPVVEERKALTVTAFERTSDYAVVADEQNMFTASFRLTLKNTGNVGLAAEEVSVSVTDETGQPLSTTTATDSLAADSIVAVPLSLTMNAGEGGTYYFYARENLTDTYCSNDAGTAIYRVVDVRAYRAQFALYEPGAYLAVESGEQFDFGYSRDTVEKQFLLKNAGTAPLRVSQVSVPEGFAVSPAGAFEVAGGAEQTVTVSLVPAEGSYGQKQGEVVIEHTLGTFAFGVSGVAVDPALFFAGFDDGLFPASWTIGDSWSILSGAARQQNNEGKATRLVTQKLTVATGESLTLQARRNYSSDPAVLNIYYSATGSDDSWQLAASLGSRVVSSVWQTLTVGTIPAGNWHLAIEGHRVSIDNILGYRETTDLPLLSVSCEGEVLKSGDAIDFGFTDRDTTIVLTVMNAGTGVLHSTFVVSDASAGDIAADGTLFTIEPQTIELAAGEQQQVSITMPVEPFGLHEAMLTIQSEGLDNVSLSLIGTTRDPQVLYVDFQEQQLPRGWQAEGRWGVTFEDFGSSNYLAENIASGGQPSPLTTSIVKVEEGDVLTFDARRYSDADYYAPVLRVSYSPDRTNWTEAADLTPQLTTEWATMQVNALPTGPCFLRFEGVNIQIDNITGVHVADDLEHLIVVTRLDVPTDATVNHRLAIAATVSNLWADSEEVAARLLIDGEELRQAEPQTIAFGKDHTFRFEYTPRKAQEQVRAQVELTYAGGTVLSDELTFAIAPETDATYAHTVSGIAVDEREQPLAGVAITLTSNTEDAVYEGTTAQDGSFSIRVWQGLYAYTLSATLDGYDPAEPQVIAFGGEDVADLMLVLTNQHPEPPVPDALSGVRLAEGGPTLLFDLQGRRQDERLSQGIGKKRLYISRGKKVLK